MNFLFPALAVLAAAAGTESAKPVGLVALSACFVPSSGDRDELAAIKTFRGLSEQKPSFKTELFPESSSDSRCDVTVKLLRSADGITAMVSSTRTTKPLFSEHRDEFAEKSLAGLYAALGERFAKEPDLTNGLIAQRDAVGQTDAATAPSKKAGYDDEPVWTPKPQTEQEGILQGTQRGKTHAQDDSDDGSDQGDGDDAPAQGMVKAHRSFGK
jgi:hypothetical protein